MRGKGKAGYVDGTTLAPNAIDDGYAKWEIENPIIMTWLIHSMIPKIGEGFLGMKIARDIWMTVASTYSRKGNYAQEFELMRLIDRSEQCSMTVIQCFSFPTTHWQRVDHLQDYHPVCPSDSEGYQTLVEKQRVFKFL